ncbi:MAG: hypothetical protein JXB06_00445 [Spirochaetales bacterium]|nr:hypothetical protein [Spirochaetales bacterium]
MFARMLEDLGRSIRRIGGFLALVVVISAIALIVAVPLWYFSSNFAAGYTIFVFALLAAGILALLIGRFVRLSREPGELRLYFSGRILPILKTAAVVVASIAVIYGIAVLISREHLLPAVLSGVAWLLLLGFLKYGRRSKR